MIAAASAGGFVLGVFVFGVVIALYFIPLIVAAIRQVPNTGSVLVINLFLGWTFIGWVVALAMACRSKGPSQNVNVYR